MTLPAGLNLRPRIRLAALLLLGAMPLLAGCPSASQSPADGQAGQTDSQLSANREQKRVTYHGGVAERAPQDAAPQVRVLIQLEVWELLVPQGTVSANEAFWKRINEQLLAVDVADRLWRNGVRVGEAPAAEWPYFKSIIDQNPAMASKQTHLAREARSLEIPVRGEEPFFNLFYFGEDGLVGRSFERCRSGLSLAFQPTPRRPGSVRIALTPFFRSTRRHLEFVREAEVRTIEYVTPEYMYDLGLVADVPLDSFVVIAPSTGMRIDRLIGGQFFTLMDKPEKLERILLLVPIPVPIEIRELETEAIVLPKQQS